jgi:hypothetical protein
MKTYRSAFLLPFNIPINTIRDFWCFGVFGVKKKSFIFAVPSELAEDGQKALTANWRFCATAAVTPLERKCEIGRLSPATTVVEAAAAPSRRVVVGKPRKRCRQCTDSKARHSRSRKSGEINILNFYVTV